MLGLRSAGSKRVNSGEGQERERREDGESSRRAFAHMKALAPLFVIPQRCLEHGDVRLVLRLERAHFSERALHCEGAVRQRDDARLRIDKRAAKNNIWRGGASRSVRRIRMKCNGVVLKHSP